MVEEAKVGSSSIPKLLRRVVRYQNSAPAMSQVCRQKQESCACLRPETGPEGSLNAEPEIRVMSCVLVELVAERGCICWKVVVDSLCRVF